MSNLDQTIASIFDGLGSTFNKNQIQLEIKQILLNKRARCVSSTDYIDSLLKNVAFNVEYCKAMQELIAHIINTRQYPNMDACVKVLQSVQGDIKQSMDRLVPTYRQIILHEKTIADQTAKLEMIYGNSKLSSDFLAMFIDSYCDPNNERFFSPLYNYNSEQVVETIQKYADFYAVSLLDGVFFVGQPYGK